MITDYMDHVVSCGLVELDFGAAGIMMVARNQYQSKMVCRSVVKTLNEMSFDYFITNEREFQVLDIEGKRKPVKVFLSDEEEVCTDYYDRHRWIRCDEFLRMM